MASGRRTLLIAAVVAMVAAGGGFVAARFVISPAEAAAQATPPAAAPITVPVEETELKAAVTARGDVGYAGAVEVSVPVGEAVQVVTGLPRKAGDPIEAADVLIEISGRPVIALPGTVPGYRTLSYGSKGADVEQLQKALTSLGHYDGPIDGTYGTKVAEAVAALYKSRDYAAPTAGPEAEAAVDQAEQAVSDATQQLADAKAAHAAASKGPKKSEKLAAQAAVDAAATDLETARNTPTEPDPHAVTKAQRSLDQANTEVQQAQQQLDEAEQALARAQIPDVGSPGGQPDPQDQPGADRTSSPSPPAEHPAGTPDSDGSDAVAPTSPPTGSSSSSVGPSSTVRTPPPTASGESASGGGFLEPGPDTNLATSAPLGLRGSSGWRAPRAAPTTGDSAAGRQGAQREVDQKRAALEQATAAADAAQQALAAAEEPGAPDPAAIAKAQDQLDVAIAQRDELLAGPDSEATAATLASAKKQLTAARQQLTEATAEASTPLPAGEVLFLADLPRRVASIDVKTGAIVEGAVMTVSGSGLQVTATVAADQAELLETGMTASLAAAGVDPVAGVITAIEPGDDGVAVTLEPQRLTEQQTKALAGTNVKVIVDIGSTAGEVLAVPVAALFSRSDGSTEVEIRNSGGGSGTGGTGTSGADRGNDGRDDGSRFQRVRTGLTADGLVEVVPQSADGKDLPPGSTTLQAGDLVVVGR